MFQSIRKSLQQRHNEITANSSVSVLARNIVQRYIHEMYPDAVLTVTVRYDVRERLVVISTPSKTLAGELTLNARELRAQLTAQHVPVNRIIAR